MAWLEVFGFLADRQEAKDLAQANGRINDLVGAHNGLAHIFMLIVFLYGLGLIALAVQNWLLNRKLAKLRLFVNAATGPRSDR